MFGVGRAGRDLRKSGGELRRDIEEVWLVEPQRGFRRGRPKGGCAQNLGVELEHPPQLSSFPCFFPVRSLVSSNHFQQTITLPITPPVCITTLMSPSAAKPTASGAVALPKRQPVVEGSTPAAPVWSLEQAPQVPGGAPPADVPLGKWDEGIRVVSSTAADWCVLRVQLPSATSTTGSGLYAAGNSRETTSVPSWTPISSGTSSCKPTSVL